MKHTIIAVTLTFALTAFALHAMEQKAFTGAGIIESTTGGFMFPDGSVQKTAATSPPGCKVIEAVPVVIDIDGLYCLDHDLVTTIETGVAIDITSNWVTIDMNGWSLVGLGAGSPTGIRAHNKQQVTIRNGKVDGFGIGILMGVDSVYPTGHLVEDTHVVNFKLYGIWVEGLHNTVRRNRVIGYDTSGPEPAGIRISGNSGRVVDNDIFNVRGSDEYAYGLYLHYADNMIVKGNRIDTITTEQVLYGSAMFLFNSDAVLIRGTSITDVD